MLIMSRLATLYLPEPSFRNYDHLKGVLQGCLAQFNPKESVTLQSIKNRTRNATSWCLEDIIFHVFLELNSLDLMEKLTVPSQVSKCKLTCLALVEVLSSKSP